MARNAGNQLCRGQGCARSTLSRFPLFHEIHNRINGGKAVGLSNTQEPKQNPKDFHTEREWQKKFFAMGAKCYYCGVRLMLNDATKDHRLPRCRGGSSNIRNIVPACLPCNQKKSWRTEGEFREAYPSLSTNPQDRVGINKSKPTELPDQSTSYEFIHNPQLLAQLRKEEQSVSWAWTHPA